MRTRARETVAGCEASPCCKVCATRELLRIGRALPELPGLAAALEAGDLDWTKAREIVGIATAETESEWVDRARTLTSRALEQEVSNARVGAPPAPTPNPQPASPTAS